MMAAFPRETVTIPVDIAAVIGGRMYHNSVDTLTLADSGYLAMALKTNDGVSDFMAIRASCGGLARVVLLENPTIEAGEVPISLKNYNLASTNTSVATATSITSWSGGTEVFDDFLGFGGKKFGAEGHARETLFYLASSTSYAIYMQNLSGAAAVAQIGIDLVDWP